MEQHDDNINYKQQDAKTNNVTENPEWEINWYLIYLFLNKSIFRKLPKLPGSLSLQLQEIDSSNNFFAQFRITTRNRQGFEDVDYRSCASSPALKWSVTNQMRTYHDGSHNQGAGHSHSEWRVGGGTSNQEPEITCVTKGNPDKRKRWVLTRTAIREMIVRVRLHRTNKW